MSSRRLLDALELLKASNSVAAKHVGIRRKQLDVYTRTSSLTKGAKSRADGLVLAAQAAVALAKRFNDEPGPSTSAGVDSSSSNNNKQVVSRRNVDTGPSTDHIYTTPDAINIQKDTFKTQSEEAAPAESHENVARISDSNATSRPERAKREQERLLMAAKAESGKEGQAITGKVGRYVEGLRMTAN